MARGDIPDDRSLAARAAGWAADGMTVAAEMVIPIAAGAWVDARLGTRGLFAVVGGIIGVSAGIWSLIRMTQSLRSRRPHEPGTPGNTGEPKQ